MIPSKFNRLGIGKKLLTDDLTFIANIAGARVKLVKSGNVDTSGIQYKIKGGYWSAYNIGDQITLTKKGDFVQFRNIKNTLSTGTSNYVHFQVLDSCKCEGNVMSMINRITTALPSYSFYQLFMDCEITTAPELPAMNLGPSCYRGMFTRCEILGKAPELPARTLKASCYYEMFMECTSLYIIPKLPATTLADYCYYEMFRKCSALTSVPANLLPATTMSQYCYSNMFQGCTSLVLPPSLPAKELAIYCYQSMFQACYSLTTMPNLPATSLANYCYRNMFYLCSSLIDTKALPAEVLVNGCYYQMFMSCSKVNRIDASFTNWGAASCTQYWLDGTASSGTFIKYEFLPEIRNASHIPTRWTIEYKDAPLTLLAKQAGSAVSLSAVNITLSDIQYRTNTNLDWEDLDTDTIIELENENDFIQFKNINNNLFSISATSYAQFMMSGLFEGYGNIQSLFINSPDTVPQYSFINLFKGCTSLTKAPHLPATILGSQCYSNMFDGCSGLTILPELPASSLTYACYSNMFKGCTSITSGPVLSATTLANSCYSSMFKDCINLSAAPELPADTLKRACYYEMFYNCKGLLDAPELPALVLAGECYRAMFAYCLHLTSAPELPAINLSADCYRSMFYGCTGLTAAPELPADDVKMNSYLGMFYGCTGLTDAPDLPATTLDTSCYNQMFVNCSNLSGAPEILPAEDLKFGCYHQMFKGCSKLTKAPELPATTLTTSCYKEMFMNCIKLNDVKVKFTEWDTTATENWLNNVAASGIFTKYNSLPEFYDASHIPEGWVTDDIEIPLTLVAKQAGSAVSLNANNITINTLKYRTSGNRVWSNYELNTVIPLQNVDDYVQFKNTATTFSTSSTSYAGFSMSGLIAASGNVQSLLNYSNTAPQYCFGNLFYSCTQLIQAPELPATSLGASCYYRMFLNTRITDMPELPASSVTSYSYNRMFQGCTALTGVQSLDASSLASYAYQDMFNGCTSLIEPPEINATSLGNNCCYQMFYGCTSLTSMPNLPVTTMKNYCYQQMFQGCTNLTSISELPAEVLADGCYSEMFKNCTNLVTPPELPATELTLHCYRNMFQGCSKLNEVNVGLTDWNDSLSGTLNWLDGVSSSGTFYKSPYLSDIRGASNIPVDWDVEEEDIPLTLKATADGSAVKITRSIGTPETSTMGTGILYRTDEDVDWINYTIDDVITLNKGDYVQFMNLSSSLSVNDVLYVNFKMSGTIEGLGNIQSMLNWRNNCPMSCFNGLFLGCTSLITPPRLPATTIMQECYKDMFKNCTNLITAPELPATSVANSCYKEMFRSCTSLTTTPYLPATTLDSYCYRGMFQGCTGLTSIKGLPATTLANYCYYYMFFGCTSLTAAPELPAITLTNHCYQAMFQGCSNLNYIKVYFTSWPTAVDALTNWLTGTAASGLFVKSSLLPIEGSEGYIPSGWTIEEFLAATRSLSKNRKRMTIASIRIGDDRNESYYTWF